MQLLCLRHLYVQYASLLKVVCKQSSRTVMRDTIDALIESSSSQLHSNQSGSHKLSCYLYSPVPFQWELKLCWGATKYYLYSCVQ